MTDNNDAVAAIREFTDEIKQELSGLKQELREFRDETGKRFDEVDTRFDGQDERVARLEAGQQQLNEGAKQTAEHLLSVHGTVTKILDSQQKIIGLLVEKGVKPATLPVGQRGR